MPDIEFIDQQDITGKVLRVIETENGSCVRSLAVRYDLRSTRHSDGWTLTFFAVDAWGLDDAQRQYKPLPTIPATHAHLAIRAFEELQKLQEEYHKAKD